MSDAIKLSGVGVDCPNAGELAAFYAEITGGTVTHVTEHWASMSGPGGSIDFWSVPNHQPPTWPDGPTPKQLHLDFYVDDLEATEARVLAAGAIKYDVQPNSHHCYVYADPAGHPFCLSTWGNPDMWAPRDSNPQPTD